MEEHFLPGRSGSLKQWTEWLGQRRLLKYYVTARLDGLSSRSETFGRKITETFADRPDHLLYRSVTLSPDAQLEVKLPYTLQDGGPGGEIVVEKMTEKYSRDSGTSAHDDVAKRTYYVTEGRIRTVYHYDDMRVTRPATVIVKDRAIATTVMGDDVLVTEEEQLQQVSGWWWWWW